MTRASPVGWLPLILGCVSAQPARPLVQPSGGLHLHVEALQEASDPAREAAADLAAAVESRLPLTTAIELRLEPCGRPEVAWFPETRRILLCRELVAELASQFGPTGPAQPKATWMRSIVRFLLAHEVGHAMVDLYQVRPDGQEEVAADEFAGLFLLASAATADDLLRAGELFNRMARQPDLEAAVRSERLDRAVRLRCLWMGAIRGEAPACPVSFTMQQAWWGRQHATLGRAVGAP